MSKAAKNIAELSPAERAALVMRLKQKKAAEASRATAASVESAAPSATTASGETAIPRRAGTEPAPLSFAQQRLWFLEQMEPNAPYKVPAMFRLVGRLDVNALEQSLNEIIGRHEALRTTFDVIEGRPAQIIRPQLKLTLPVIDLRSLNPDEQAVEIRRLRERAYRQQFDFVRGPLVSAALVRLAAEEHVLMFLMHHIVSDGWSIGVLLRELCASYEAFAAGRRPSLPELPIQYADFAAWQRDYLSGEVLERQLEYWKRCLGDNVPTLELPTDRPRPPVQSYRGAFRTRLVGTNLAERLNELARHEGVTLYMLLLAAFKVLLYRYTGQSDLVVGTPIANRNRVEIENLIGFFVNTLVLRTSLSQDPPFRLLLQRVRHVTLGAYAHQDLPFEKLVEELQPERDTSRTPLFQVMFSLQNAPLPSAGARGLELSLLEDDTISSLFDLSLDIVERRDGLLCGLEYNTDLFDDATAERMLSHFVVLLEGVAREPGARLSELPLLTVEERQQLLVEWNDTRRDFPRDLCVHELFEAQAARTPDAEALVAGDERLTYAELDERASWLARRLRRLGVGPETSVGVLLGRGARAAVALLAVLKAGGAYVALDEAYPPLRLSLVLEDSGARVLLTERRFAEAFNPGGVSALFLDDDWPEPSEPSQPGEEKRPCHVAPENLAYVVYTSGTTGKPKGVLVSHRSLVNTSLAFAAHHRLTPRDRLMQFASLSFDVSSEEFFAAWLSGACVVMRPERAFDTVEEFVEFAARECVTLVNLPASFWAEWATALDERAETKAIDQSPDSLLPSTLRRVVVGNEKTLSATLERWRRRVGNSVEWSNAYGPTEATVTASNYEPDASADDDEPLPSQTSSVPIGRPIMNAELHVLDAAGQLVPVGVVGELYVGGCGLARGYQGQPALTAERFVPHPFSRRGGERLYKTGDLARRLADGQIEFRGRADEQVKVRGFRVEVGDIEAALRQHPGVRESIVAALDDGRGGSRLVAYVVERAETTPGDLRDFLGERLPEYMIPVAFVRLQELPLTPNGKLDRRRLPDPFGRGSQEAYVAPRSELERTIAGIWQEVLKVERVGINDNFFGLGGHSLLLLHVNSKLRAALRSEFPVIEMFKYPTVGKLAEHLSGARAEARTHETEPRRSATERAALLGRRRELRRRAPRPYEAPGAENA
jgi:amino acid adenylation domain-containing protein